MTAIAATVATSLGIGLSSRPSPSPKLSAPPIQLTTAQLAQWKQETATPLQREQMLQKLQAAFAGVAEVEATVPPSQAIASTTPTIQEDVALGITSTHFWVIASYADMARGAIWGAVATCVAYGVPSWLCSSAGWLLTTWSQGWGYANNHGVWAAVYWWPPYITGGRW